MISSDDQRMSLALTGNFGVKKGDRGEKVEGLRRLELNED